MKNANRLNLPILIAGIVVATCLVWTDIATSGKIDSPNSIKAKEQEQSKSPEDPCWFVNMKDNSISYEKIKERQDREMYGYPTEIPLREAIRIFNEEKQCLKVFEPYPLLTEDEIIAAIAVGNESGLQGQALQAQKDILWQIAKGKVMPKGSLLMAWTGPNVQDSPLRPNGEIKAKGITIAIFLGLENHERGTALNPGQIFVIRKTYSKIETIK